MTFLRDNNILLLFILTIVLVNPSAAQESHIFPNSSDFPTRLKNISHIESLRDTITFRPLPNITMGDIHPGRLNNLNNNRNIYLFSWDDIPGNDTGRLIKILGNIYRIKWVETAIVEKIDGGKTIKVSTGNNSILLNLNDDKTRVNLTINDVRTDEFIARMNNSRLNIYKNFTVKPEQAGLFSRNINQSWPITGNAYSVPNPQIYSTLNITSKRGAVQVQPMSSLKPGANYNNTILKSNNSRNRFDITSLKSEHKPGELLVKYAKKLPKKEFENFYKSQNITLLKDYPRIGYHLIRVDESRLENTIEGLSLSDKFEDAEPNYLVKALKTPNDSRFNELWAMNNTGQTGGTPDADIDAPQAWDISTGSKEVKVAVIDTGVDYTHEDLAGNMWTNPREIQGNGIDDDNNGFVDDYYGWDFAYDDNDPMDGNSHGTHVSGTIGGVGNNGKGVTGVSWNVSIMPLKFLDDNGSGSTSDAIDAINYATMMGADIMSNSWGGREYSSALEAAIQAADNAGILFVAASGNWAESTDQYPNYPSGYDVPNVMSIAATDKNDNLASFSNYGPLTVDIGAPGADILSSVPGNNYSSKSGTSMAAPHVSGAAALLKAFNPSLTYLEIKDILMKSVDPLPSLNGKTVTGGRLNIHKAITFKYAIHNINKSKHYTTLQTAIDDASPGNEIHVESGTYYENVNVNKKLTLRGIGMPVVDASGGGSAIKLTANGSTLEGFTATKAYNEGIKITSNNNTLRGNHASNNYVGISLSSSSNNTLIGNNASRNLYGISLDNSGKSVLINNIMNENNYNFGLDGSSYSDFDNQIDTNNLVDGKPLYYIKGATGTVYDSDINAGTFYCISCVNITIKNLDLINNTNGIFFLNTTHSIIQNVTASNNVVSISLFSSGNNTLIGNNASNNGDGIFLSSSSNNMLISNNANSDYDSSLGIGISLDSSGNNTLIGNNASNYLNGLYLGSSNNNTLISNNASNNIIGISLYVSSNNTLISNNANSDYVSFLDIGISLDSSSKNTLIGNNASNYLNGLYLGSSNNNTLISNNASNNIIGISLYVSSYNNALISNNASNNIIGISLYVFSNYNTLGGNNIFNNNDGIDLYDSSNNMLRSNNVSNNNDNGILLKSSSNNNSIYNNIFNNINNVQFYGSNINTWNTTIQSSANIIGGSYLGGNFWANPSGNGFSQTCVDSNNDGLCDLKYVLNTLNIDNLPLKYKTAITAGITVVSPNGGENWRRGTTQTIRWNSTGNPGAYVKIELLKPGKPNQLIISSTPNDGLHPWLIPPAQTPGNDYKIKITSTTNVAYSDTSDDNFTIPVPSFKLVSPNGGENWTRGTTQTIRWNSTESPGTYVKIELLKPGKPNQLIVSATLNDGSHPWLIPSAQAPGSDYKVKITSTINASNNDISDGNFTIPVPSFKVVSPNGGENWTRGTTQTIRWNSTESPGTYVRIELLKPGKPNQLIISATLNDGSHPWLIPPAQAPGSDYKVKITSTINVSNNDTSVGNFTIPIPSFKLVSPNGGENWTRGTIQTIRWNSTESPGTYVKIELLRPGKPNQLIISATLNDGSHPWLIPPAQAPGTDYKVKITSTINVSNNDISDDNFTIPVPSFKLFSPNGSESWIRGTTQTIRWNSTENPKGYVKIELLKPGKPNQLIISATLNDGSYPWLIPPAQAPGTDYKVKITSTINASNNDISDDNFTIPVPSFTVVSPNGGENWTRGTTQTIKWTSTENPKGYVKIELLKPGKPNQLIVSATLNDGSHPWPIPALQAQGTDYKVKITSTSNLSYTDMSDNNYTINI